MIGPQSIDTDGNGIITVDELKIALSTMDDKIKVGLMFYVAFASASDHE